MNSNSGCRLQLFIYGQASCNGRGHNGQSGFRGNDLAFFLKGYILNGPRVGAEWDCVALLYSDSLMSDYGEFVIEY